MKCIVCGNPISYDCLDDCGYYKVPLGRKKDYCSANCREYNKFFNALQKRLDNMSPTDEAKRLLKGQLFRLANTIKIDNSRSFGTKNT